jgi:hypothetical protein
LAAGIAYRAFFADALSAAVSALGAACSDKDAHLAAGELVRALSSTLDVFAMDMPTESIAELLQSAVAACQPGHREHGGGAAAAAEVQQQVMVLCASVLTQGGSKRNPQLLKPTLDLCLAVWDSAGRLEAGNGNEGDPWQLRAKALVTMLVLVRARWRQLTGGTALPSAGGQESALASSANPIAAGVQQAAQLAAAAGPPVASGAVATVVHLLLEFFSAAASSHVVLAAPDVRAVLEELYEVQVATRIYASPHFGGSAATLAGFLLDMLGSRLYWAAQNELVDTLFALATTDREGFHRTALPGFLARRLSAAPAEVREGLVMAVGPVRDAHAFEREVLVLINDFAYWEKAFE